MHDAAHIPADDAPPHAAAQTSRPCAGSRALVERRGRAPAARRVRRAAGDAAKVHRRDAVVAPEGPGELRGLAVADATRNVRDANVGRLQQGGAVLHPDGRELVTE